MKFDTAAELTFGGSIKIKNNENNMRIFNPSQYFEVGSMSEVVGREDIAVELEALEIYKLTLV